MDQGVGREMPTKEPRGVTAARRQAMLNSWRHDCTVCQPVWLDHCFATSMGTGREVNNYAAVNSLALAEMGFVSPRCVYQYIWGFAFLQLQ